MDSSTFVKELPVVAAFCPRGTLRAREKQDDGISSCESRFRSIVYIYNIYSSTQQPCQDLAEKLQVIHIVSSVAYRRLIKAKQSCEIRYYTSLIGKNDLSAILITREELTGSMSKVTLLDVLICPPKQVNIVQHLGNSHLHVLTTFFEIRVRNYITNIYARNTAAKVKRYICVRNSCLEMQIFIIYIQYFSGYFGERLKFSMCIYHFETLQLLYIYPISSHTYL